MKRFVFFALGFLSFVTTFAQVDSLSLVAEADTITQIEYDTVVVDHPPVVVNRKVLYLAEKEKSGKESFVGVSVGINYSTSIYHTCKDCGRYDAYAQKVRSSQQAGLGFNLSTYYYKNIRKRFFYETELRYSLYSERFKLDSTATRNYYQQLGLSLSILYEITKATSKNRFFIGVGGNAHYLLSASGQTATIFQTNQTTDINDFRVFNKLLGGVQIAGHWLRPLKENLYVLLHPEVAFEITSFTSYQEYYLQNRFLYSINVGLIKKM